MRVCHVITRLIIGGAQENTILTCEGLAAAGHEVTLLVGPETGPEGSLWARARDGGYAVETVESLKRAVSPRLDWRCLRALRAAFRRLRPDIVHTHSSKAGILGRIAARHASVPIVVHTIHGMSFNRTQSWPVRRFFRTLERHCGGRTDGIICVAEAMAEQARHHRIVGRAEVATIYSGIEIECFDPGRHNRGARRAACGFEREDFVVGTIARLFPNKGYEQLLAVLPALMDAVPRARFLWVGDGAARPRYEAALTRMGLRDRVHLAGLVSPDQIPELVSAMDVLVHVSQWEGLPRAVPQALLMRVPVVSFDNDGAPEVVRSGRTGELVRLGDGAALVAAIRKLAGDESLRQRYGEAGRRLALERFDHRRMVEHIEGFYRRLTEQRRSGEREQDRHV
jgi:glycosyltransferase involved in cell wall biosynthesis